ncbi:MAG: flagellar biosynthetic protein FliR [Nitriliruptor sp.]|uniref:flagellar biosynthetic protein FliR n=1 Tax=Nitriliruptor sp. TaxID=2448056 RepID=UPI0034A09954
MELALDAHWASGYLLAMIRVSAFVVATPLLPRSIPVVGRAGVVIVLGFALTSPMADTSVPALFGAAGVNVAVGLLLGFLTGVVLHLFTIAGDALDVTSGLSVAAVFDPLTGDRGAILGRLFPLAAVTIFLAVGGLGALVEGLAASVTAIPLDGAVRFDPGLVGVAIAITGRLLVAGVELALPAIAALFLSEVVLGLASRFAPQANVLMLGLPLKIILLLVTVGLVLLLFPEAMAGMMEMIERAFVDGIDGMRVA